MEQRYWFFDWLDEHGLSEASPHEVHSYLHSSSSPHLDSLIEAAQSATPRLERNADVLIAGTGVDIGERDFDCRHIDHRMPRIDTYFRRAWWYFDRIAVDDFLRRFLLNAVDTGEHIDGEDSPFEYWYRLDINVQILRQLRAMGADELIEFYSDPARMADSAPEANLVSRLAEHILAEGTFEVIRANAIRVTHPELDEYFPVEIPAGTAEADARRFAARQVALRIGGSLAEDLASARILGAPIAVAPGYGRLSGAKPTINDVLLRLELPILDGLHPSELRQIRHDEGEAFLRLKVAVRKGIRQMMTSDQGASAETIAHEVVSDLVEPELANVRQRLRLAESAMNKKQISAVGVGSLLTVCGLLSGLAPVALAGIGLAAGGLVVPEQQYIDERKEIELSDMFFLWKASVTNERH